jgi:pyruvate kinase
MIKNGLKALMAAGYAGKTDRIVVVAGVPIGTPLVANMVRVYHMGNILCSGERGHGKEVTGSVVRARSAADAMAKLKMSGNEILVTEDLDESFLPIIKGIAGYVLEGFSLLAIDRIYEENPNCVGIGSVAGALSILTDNLEITINGEEKHVYKGMS